LITYSSAIIAFLIALNFVNVTYFAPSVFHPAVFYTISYAALCIFHIFLRIVYKDSVLLNPNLFSLDIKSKEPIPIAFEDKPKHARHKDTSMILEHDG
jgi:hypothetical protein